MESIFNKTRTYVYPYNRKIAVNYARRWAYDRNPKYYDFEYIGGDCTNFVSQVLHAGRCTMNYNKCNGWYYNNLNSRSPSWTGVEYFYKFLISNQGRGPIGRVCHISELELGDIVQLNFENDKRFNHSLIVTKIEEPGNLKSIYISTHTIDRYNYSIDRYNFTDIRFIHIIGYKL